jgi:hypothetical protein
LGTEIVFGLCGSASSDHGLDSLQDLRLHRPRLEYRRRLDAESSDTIQQQLIRRPTGSSDTLDGHCTIPNRSNVSAALRPVCRIHTLCRKRRATNRWTDLARTLICSMAEDLTKCKILSLWREMLSTDHQGRTHTIRHESIGKISRDHVGCAPAGAVLRDDDAGSEIF